MIFFRTVSEALIWSRTVNCLLEISILFVPLPAFAESPVRKGGDECEKGIHRSLGEGGSASAGSAEDVKMPRAAARGASLTEAACLSAPIV